MINKDNATKGNLERLLICILTINLKFTSIAFVFTAKSIVREKKLREDSAFAETYIIGTFTNIVIAILGGWLFNLMKFSVI